MSLITPITEPQPGDYFPPPLENKCKIVFLDFDGVICNPSYSIAMGDRGDYALIEPRAGMLVRRLCQVTGAKIVISSTWRLGRNQEWIGDILGAAIPDIQRHLIAPDRYWATGVHVNRQLEIQQWLKKYQTETGIEVERFVVLDDDTLHSSHYQPLREITDFQVRTHQYDGFGFANYMEAEMLLTTGKRPEFVID